MRIQATALLSMDEKAILESQAEDHETTLSTILRAAHMAFTSLPRLEQVVWIKMVEKEST
jgi:hypothetical protein